jgi:acetolactate synthase-1/2/3 large subunit
MHSIRSYVPKPVLNIDKVKEAALIMPKPFIYGQGIILGQAEAELKQLKI